MLDGGAHPARHVELDGRPGPVGARVGVQEDGGGVGGQFAELAVVRGADQQAVETAGGGGLGEGGTAPAGADHDRQAVPAGLLVDALQHPAEERAEDVRHRQQDHPAAAEPQLPAGRLRAVAEAAGGLPDPFPGGAGDPAAGLGAGEDQRDGGLGDPGEPGHVPAGGPADRSRPGAGLALGGRLGRLGRLRRRAGRPGRSGRPRRPGRSGTGGRSDGVGVGVGGGGCGHGGCGRGSGRGQLCPAAAVRTASSTASSSAFCAAIRSAVRLRRPETLVVIWADISSRCRLSST